MKIAVGCTRNGFITVSGRNFSCICYDSYVLIPSDQFPENAKNTHARAHTHTRTQMMRPQIQNDFASYRRHLHRMKVECEKGLLPQLPVADTDANAISMFIAEVHELICNGWARRKGQSSAVKRIIVTNPFISETLHA